MKRKVAVVFGGKSAEHEVSIHSAINVFNAIDRSKYDCILLGMDKMGNWRLSEDLSCIANAGDPENAAIREDTQVVVPAAIAGGGAVLLEPGTGKVMGELDVVFPVMHGTLGEDGALQGFFRVMDTPVVGADVLGSSVGMDKDVMKRLLVQASIPVTPYRVIRRNESLPERETLVSELGLPLFVKPCNLGSSVGISMVKEASGLASAIEEAFLYDDKIIVESAVEGRELECAVLGGDPAVASLCGEIVTETGFYSYEAKYVDEEAARLIAPVTLDSETLEKAQRLAVDSFKVLECAGMARVDMFLRENGDLLINEINTVPGFTKISMYPKLWEVSGIPPQDLTSRLIELALEAHSHRARLNREARKRI